ncbi:MAG: sigma-70 family RNA polymerase sigma factor [Bacteroidia bacterium]|nr:sigma-70 family RNA polymerase sigma factor [Bacteroidia bacterium]
MKKASPYASEPFLVQSLINKDREAFSYLYDNYNKALFGIIHRIVGEEDLANDVLQEAFVKIWKNIDGYQVGKGSLFTWLLNICRNLSIDTLRSKEYKNQLQNQNLEDNVNNVDRQEQMESKVDHIGLKEVLQKLKPDQKILIDKVYFEGYTHDEVSKELNIPLGTVKTRIRAAIIHLKGILNVQGEQRVGY